MNAVCWSQRAFASLASVYSRMSSSRPSHGSDSAWRFVRCAGYGMAVVMFFSGTVSAATPVLEDHFDDGVLDPAWTVTLTNATAWSYFESGTYLTATDIEPTVINSGNGGPIATVTLRREFAPVSDFHIDFDFSWDSKTSGGTDSVRAMQSVELRLFDETGGTVGRAIMSDGWVCCSGSQYVGFGGTATDTGIGSAPLAGTAAIDIDRTGGLVSAEWDGVPFYSGVAASAVHSVELSFRYYAYDSGGVRSHMGTFNVDQVRIEHRVVPEPSAAVLLSFVATCLVWRLRPFLLSEISQSGPRPRHGGLVVPNRRKPQRKRRQRP